jgi:hypothetical protein
MQRPDGQLHERSMQQVPAEHSDPVPDTSQGGNELQRPSFNSTQRPPPPWPSIKLRQAQLPLWPAGQGFAGAQGLFASQESPHVRVAV